METKTCPTCNLSKPKDEFRPSRNRKDGIAVYCRECDKSRQSAWYKKHKERLKPQREEFAQKLRSDNTKRLIEHFSRHPCVGCGETDPVLLDFDHRDHKKLSISDMILGKYSWSSIMEEISKCEVRCVKCHRLRHAEEDRWLIWELTRLSSETDSDPRRDRGSVARGNLSEG